MDVEEAQQREYRQAVSELADKLRMFDGNMTTLERWASYFETSKDTEEIRKRSRLLVEKTASLAHSIGEGIKTLSLYTSISPDESRVRKRQNEQLVSGFQSNLSRFQELSKMLLKREKHALAEVAPQGAARNVGGNFEDDFFDEDYGGADSLEQMQMSLGNEIEFNESIIAEREESIREIESAVREVNSMFVELAELVMEQGYIIDNIESNISNAAHSTNRAAKELTKAASYQRSYRSRLLILLLLVLFIALVTVLFIALGVKLAPSLGISTSALRAVGSSLAVG